MSDLTLVSVSPSPIERQKVNTCLKVFSENTCAALKCHPNLKDTNVDGTIILLRKVIAFWKIINVKSPDEAIHKNDLLWAKITDANDHRLQFLRDMAYFAVEMRGGYGKKRVKEAYTRYQ